MQLFFKDMQGRYFARKNWVNGNHLYIESTEPMENAKNEQFEIFCNM